MSDAGRTFFTFFCCNIVSKDKEIKEKEVGDGPWVKRLSKSSSLNRRKESCSFVFLLFFYWKKYLTTIFIKIIFVTISNHLSCAVAFAPSRCDENENLRFFGLIWTQTLNNRFFTFLNLMDLVMELFSRRRWIAGLVQQSHVYRMLPCMCWHNFWGLS